MNVKAALLAAIAVAFAAPALAHHSFAMFDAEKTVTMQGTVKEFEWTNPHSWLRITADDKATGKSAQWALEMGSPGQQARVGWKPDSVKPGDKVTVTFHPLKDGSRGGQFMSAVLPSGQQLGNGGQRNNPEGN
jgi:hypothetical protein